MAEAACSTASTGPSRRRKRIVCDDDEVELDYDAEGATAESVSSASAASTVPSIRRRKRIRCESDDEDDKEEEDVQPDSDDGATESLSWGWSERAEHFAQMAQGLLIQHKLQKRGWSIGYDRARTRAGQCVFAYKMLTFSNHLVAKGSAAEMRNTVLHEIAHALAGPSHNHDDTWSSIAISIGCDGKRCHTIKLSTMPWVFQCSRGCWSVPRHKRSLVNRAPTCNQCGASCQYKKA